MQENEVIVVNGIPQVEYLSLIEECIKYALISKPFTIRRIGSQTLEQAILNIFKGKIAEALFKQFCFHNAITLDWETCTTPFWQIDRRDFILKQLEWDIKNNFIYHAGDLLQTYNYTDLPCLIPNKKAGDQWSTRNEIKNTISLGTSYLFSFLKSASLNNNKRGPDFYNFTISDQQLSFIDALENQYRGFPTDAEPFSEEWFWNEMRKRGSLDFIQLSFLPHLIITGYANINHWNLFKDTGPYDRFNNFQNYLNPRWYVKSNNGYPNFMNGTFWATISNSTVPVSSLPSFLSLYPNLRQNINCAIIKT